MTDIPTPEESAEAAAATAAGDDPDMERATHEETHLATESGAEIHHAEDTATSIDVGGADTAAEDTGSEGDDDDDG